MDNYERLEKVGEGTYGMVYKCRQLATGQIVALKKIRLEEEDEGVPSTALREVSVLMELGQSQHAGAECIVRLLDVIHCDESLSLVFEYLDLDLKRYMDVAAKAATAVPPQGKLDANGNWSVPINAAQELPHNVKGKGRANRGLPPDLVAKFMSQLLLGLSHLHSRRILHRDLKPQNLLIDKRGNLKIADFGLARAFGVPLRTYTHEIITLWYRPLEVLLGGRHYTTAVDVWSCATIFAEMCSGLPLVPGDSEIDQIFKIFRLMGTPTPDTWPGLTQMPDFKGSFPRWRPAELPKVLPEMDGQALHLLNSMLQIDPERRISAKNALRHPYFHAASSAPASPSSNPLGQPLSPLLNPWGTTGPPCPQQFSSSSQPSSAPSSVSSSSSAATARRPSHTLSASSSSSSLHRMGSSAAQAAAAAASSGSMSTSASMRGFPSSSGARPSLSQSQGQGRAPHPLAQQLHALPPAPVPVSGHAQLYPHGAMHASPAVSAPVREALMASPM
ncbi:hypothetical protein JCM10207_008401 [Rhodosporidiobolus poonsookiae]